MADVLAAPGMIDGEQGAMRLLAVLRELGCGIERAQRLERNEKDTLTGPAYRFLRRVVDVVSRHVPEDRVVQVFAEVQALTGAEVTEEVPGTPASADIRPNSTDPSSQELDARDRCCGTCGEVAENGFCRRRGFYTRPALPACGSYTPRAGGETVDENGAR